MSAKLLSSDRRIVRGLTISAALLVLVAGLGGSGAGLAYTACDQVTDNGALKTGCGAVGGYAGAEAGTVAGAAGGAYAGAQLGGTAGSLAGPVGTFAGGAIGAFAGAA
ncbi:hypothetical protein VB773_16375 [Haloarculaceae archaeon H-GB2-1]|nr:hypothetical protein [Haloarculaceae archaeon H-GB1-1]MEA5387507.1 hypothetical protein [Haloarculaceae archaeon H-GB11]MEA5408989.1 hypothetical protein [Haloarculaceae archaeon H-GB2-1]